MAEEDTTQRLSEYSTRTNVNAMNIALVDQRATVLERRTDEYHARLHKAEDEILVIKTKQEIHDVQIQGMRKLLAGNGDRATIPMDIARMDQMIANILKVDWNKVQADIGTLSDEIQDLRDWKEKIESRAWQVWFAVIVAILTSVLGLVLK
jgi:hypothetical protein